MCIYLFIYLLGRHEVDEQKKQASYIIPFNLKFLTFKLIIFATS